MNKTTLLNGFAHKSLANNLPIKKSFVNNHDNNVLQLFILSEDKNAASALAMQLAKLKNGQVCRIYHDADSLLYAFNSNNAVVFADTTILTENIIADIKLAQPNVLIVALSNPVVQLSKNIHEYIFHYLQAPYAFGEVFSIIYQGVAFFNQKNSGDTHKKSFVFIKSEYKLLKINLSEILFIAGMKDYIKIWLKDKTTPLTTLQNLKEFEKKLPQADFIRVHKSYIVAFQHIDCIARNEIMIGTYSIPVGDAFRNGLNGFIETYS